MNVDHTDDHLLRLLARAFDEVSDTPTALIAAAQALSPSALVVDLAARRAMRVERRLAAAAASDRRLLEREYRSPDGAIVTQLQENEEGHLLVSIETHLDGPRYVEFAWTPVDADGVGDRRTLRTPLSNNRRGWAVHYDLGRVDGFEAIDVEPAEAIEHHDIAEDDVTFACSLELSGSARRAWSFAAEHLRALSDPLAELITAHLGA